MLAKFKKFKEQPALLAQLKSSLWMLTEQILRIFSGVFVGIYVARQLGPVQFGHLSYALALGIILMVVSRIGMDANLVRDLVGVTDKRSKYMGTSFWLIQIVSISSFIGLVLYTWRFELHPVTQMCIWIISLGLLVQGFHVIDYSFQSEVLARNSSFAKSLALICSSVAKTYLVWGEYSLFWVAGAFAAEYILTALFLILAHFINRRCPFLFHFDLQLAKKMLHSAWPMTLASLSAVLYMRIDLIMVEKMLGTEPLALYAAATRIYEGWIIIPYVLSISLLPSIVKAKVDDQAKYESYLSKIMATLFYAGLLAAGIIFFFGDWLILISFGKAYLGSFPALSVIIFAAPLYAINAVTSRYLTAESKEKKIAFRTTVGLFVNILLNFLLIPRYGIQGAAIATVVTILIADYFLNYLDRELKQLVKICNHSIILGFFWKRSR